MTVTDANEVPEITSDNAFTIEENTTTVTTVTATDPENAALVYSITGSGADDSLFAIDSASGALSFVAAPDFEAPGDSGSDNVYDVQIQVSDGVNAVTQDIAVTVTDDPNEVPEITSDSAFTIEENTTTVTTVTATDPENATLVYSITGSGADDALFAIDSASGTLSFIAAPDFEAPGDSGSDNVYDVQVQVSDGVNAVTQNIAVTVTDANEVPEITSDSAFTIEENTTTVTTVTATDPENAALVYSITGSGADDSLFAIDSASGALSFSAAPDFEAPGDSGSDNVYDVQVQVSDGSLNATQSVSVTVTNNPNDTLPINDPTFPVDLTIQSSSDPALYYGLFYSDADGDGLVDTGDGWYLDVNGSLYSSTNPAVDFSTTAPVITADPNLANTYNWTWTGDQGYTINGSFTTDGSTGVENILNEGNLLSHTYTITAPDSSTNTIDLIDQTLDGVPVVGGTQDFQFFLESSTFNVPSEPVTFNDPEYPVDLTLETIDSFYYGLFFDDLNADGTIDPGDGWFLDIRGSEDGTATSPVSFSNNGPVITQVDDTTYTWEWTGSNGYTASGEFSVLPAANLVGAVSEDQITEHTYRVFQNGVEQFTIDLVNQTIAGVEEEIVESYHDLEFILGSTGFVVPVFDPENASLDVEDGDEQRGIITLLTSLTLSLTLTTNATSFANELVAFVVEDDQGTVRDAEGNAITPGTEGFSQSAYLQAILASSSTQLVLSNLNGADTDLPDDFAAVGNLETELSFAEGTRVAFFLVVNGTTDDLQNNLSGLEVFFSNLNGALIENLASSGFSLSFGDDEAGTFDDLTFEVKTLPDQANNTIAPGQLNKLGKTLRVLTEAIDDFVEVFDFRGFDGNGDGVTDTDGTYQVSINIYSEAAYDNLLGFYVINPDDGSVAGIAPSASNRQSYIDAVLANAIGTTTEIQNEEVNSFSLTIAAGSVIVPFIIANSSTANADYSNIYFPFASLNSDGLDHVRSLGRGIFGIEDLPGAISDNDFDDVIIQINTIA